MSIYTGDPPYEAACDCTHAAHRHTRGGQCSNAGPASWSEDEALDNAKKEDWEVYVEELDYGELCASCIAAGHRPEAKAEEQATTEGEATT